MKENFPGHYRLTSADIERLWAESIIILDTNSILNLYRYRAEARNDLIEALEAFKDRLWIPYQTALEFHRNRVDVIIEQKSAYEKAQVAINSSISSIVKLFESKARNPHSNDSIAKELETIVAAGTAITNQLGVQKTEQIGVSEEDWILLKINELFEGRVGPCPTPAEVKEIHEMGALRYQYKIPPGFEDDAKKNTYSDRGIQYEAKYGDLIAWKQIIDHVKANSIKSVIIVSDDKKEDWWQIVSGMTLGPHPSLFEEIRRDAGVHLFHMYRSDQFLQYSAERRDVKLEPHSVQRVQEANLERSSDSIDPMEASQSESALDDLPIGRAVLERHEEIYGLSEVISMNRGEILTKDEHSVLYRIRYLRILGWNGEATLSRIILAIKKLEDKTLLLPDLGFVYIVATEKSVWEVMKHAEIIKAEIRVTTILIGYYDKERRAYVDVAVF